MPVFCGIAFAEGLVFGKRIRRVAALIVMSFLFPFGFLYGVISVFGDAEAQMWKEIATFFGGLVVSPIALLGAWVGRVTALEARNKVTPQHE